jgi:vancomycin resistance protein VanJ
MAVLRALIIAAAAVPIAGWLTGIASETGDAIGSLLLPALVVAVAALLPIGGRARRSHWLAVAALVLVGTAAIGPEVAARLARAPVDTNRSERLVVVTHNVSVANVAAEATLAALLASDADVILLQEVDGSFAAMLPRLRARYRWSNPCVRRCSLAIFARLPMERVRYRLRDPGGRAFGPPLLQTILHPPGRAPVPLLTLHLTWPIPAGPQRKARIALARAIGAVPFARAILTGDFNSTPWSHAMRRLDADMAPLQRITRMVPSWPARLRGTPVLPAFLPIDHIFVGPDWQVASVERLGRTGSDHLPIRAVLVAGNPAPAMPRAAEPRSR